MLCVPDAVIFWLGFFFDFQNLQKFVPLGVMAMGNLFMN
jgi:hypothetical protein